MLRRSKLQIPNPLPRPRVQFPIRNRHRHTRADQSTFNVCRHVIRTFARVLVQIPLAVFWRDAVEGVAHVGADILVPVFVKREGAGCMLHEEVEEADFVVLDLWDGGGDVVGY